MIYPIIAYGDPILRKVTRPVEKDELDIKKLVQDMFETMYNASGVGIAAPQIGLNLRIFVVDGTPMNEGEPDEERDPSLENFRMAFINPEILHEEGEKWAFEEGCLSIPGIRADVQRPEKLRIRYQDEEWNVHEREFDGMAARIIQHEYDHLEGKLFTDYLPTLKKQLLKKKLSDIAKGVVDVDYRMKFSYKK